MTQLERRIEFSPAWDRRHDDPKKNYGIGWYLPGTCLGSKTIRGFNGPVADASNPMPFDLGYHSRVPRYEGQEPMRGECSLVGGTCYAEVFGVAP